MIAILTSPGDFVVLSQDKPFRYVTNFTGWFDDIVGTGPYKKEFRWGTTNRVRASWMELTTQNVTNVVLDGNNDLFVDFRITLLGNGMITINSIGIEYVQDPIAQDPYLGFYPEYTTEYKGNISSITKIENFSFKPYEVEALKALYFNMAYTVNEMFGWEFLYARAVPMSIGRDVVLSEWTLYDVDEPKCLKAMVPDNNFPDEKINFNNMGLDFEVPFEVHITKQYFEDTFGNGAGPQKGDIMYLPVRNRIYEIGSAYLYNDLIANYWIVSLIKYQPSANRKEPTSLKDTFEEMTTSHEREFNEEVHLEKMEITKPQQYDPTIGSRFYDPIRENVSDELLITTEKLLNYSLLISESQYDLRSLFTNGVYREALNYKAKVDLGSDVERAFSCWFKELQPAGSPPKDNVKGGLTLGGMVGDMVQLTFKVAARRTYISGDLIKITKFNGFTVYGEWQATNPVAGGFNYTILVRQDILTFLNAYYPNWSSASASGYVAEKTYENILFNGYDIPTVKGFRIGVIASRYILIKRNELTFMYILKNNIVQNYWYALFINMSNFYRQLSVDLWIRKWNETNLNAPKTTNLENIYSSVQTIVPTDLSVDINYNILSGNVMTTNLRLYNNIETDQLKQINMLNQTIVHDSQFSLIIDNAVPLLKLHFIANTK